MDNTTHMIIQSPADYNILESGASSLQCLDNSIVIVTTEGYTEK